MIAGLGQDRIDQRILSEIGRFTPAEVIILMTGALIVGYYMKRK